MTSPEVLVATPGSDLECAFGLDLDTVYRIAQTFVHEKAEKAFPLSFSDRIYLSALSFQVKYGKYEANKAVDPGFFDFIGKRRITEWKLLGDMSPIQAMTHYVHLIEKLCPLFRSYLEAYSRNYIGSTQELRSNSESQSLPPSPSEDPALAFFRLHESDIRAALNAQTREQFEQYALQQFPTDADKRAQLIAHLQDRHFNEYVVYSRQRCEFVKNTQRQNVQEVSPHLHSPLVPGSAVFFSPESAENQSDFAEKPTSPDGATRVPNGRVFASPPTALPAEHPLFKPTVADEQQPTVADTPLNGTEPSDDERRSVSPSLVRPASMWTRSELQEFKNSLLDSKDSIVKVGCGEVITIRVPAYPSGTSIVWEFATDDYDIGFGLYFEWEPPESQPPENAAEELVEGITLNSKQSPRSADLTAPAANERPPLVDEIIPVFRRNCHLEIYCGAHVYPGPGTYLFKFDNSYSLWRWKTLYYRVYYTC